MKDNQKRIVKALEYDPQKAISYSGDILPKPDWDDEEDEEPSHEYAFIDTDDGEDESSEEEQSTSKTAKKGSMLNLDKGINDDYKTLLKEKGFDLPSEIFKEQTNVDDIIKKVGSKIKRFENYILRPFNKKGETIEKLK